MDEEWKGKEWDMMAILHRENHHTMDTLLRRESHKGNRDTEDREDSIHEEIVVGMKDRMDSL